MFHRFSLPVFLSVLMPLTVIAAPSPGHLNKRQELSTVSSVTTLTNDQINSLTPFIQFSRQTYCSMTTGTSCGLACTANPGFDLTLHGGDGQAVQFFFVGYWPSQNAVVVGHQGTESVPAALADADAGFTSFDSSLFPDLPSGILGHSGFIGEQKNTASTILTEVKRLISSNNASTVITTGHSLGAAIAEIDALFFKQNLPSSVDVRSVTFGTPRVGNAAYAKYFDSQLLGKFFRVNHGSDPVPVVPPTSAGFVHPTGEVHLLSLGGAVACPGEDDAVDSQCQIRTVPTLLQANDLDHLGPYNGLTMGSCL